MISSLSHELFIIIFAIFLLFLIFLTVVFWSESFACMLLILWYMAGLALWPGKWPAFIIQMFLVCFKKIHII